MPDPQSPPRNVDRDIPVRTGEDMGAREPLGPAHDGDADERPPLPDDETYERSRDRNPLDEERLRFDRLS